MNDHTRRAALRSLLIERRARIQPEEVGLPRHGRRRVEGLRREEVAMLVGVSVAWYTQFETGNIRVSARMLDNVAKALRFDEQERLYLFSLAIDEMPTVVHYDTAAASDGREHAVLMHFAKRARSASCLQELEETTVDLLYDMAKPVEVAQVIHADLGRREFWTTTQRTAPGVEPFPSDPQSFSLIHDGEQVLIRGEMFTEHNIPAAKHALMKERHKKYGTGRFISAGIRAGSLVGALNVTEPSREPYSEREKYRLGLIAEIFALTLTSRY